MVAVIWTLWMDASGTLVGADNRKGSGDFAADDADAGGVLELAGSLLETEVEGFLFEVAKTGAQLVTGQAILLPHPSTKSRDIGCSLPAERVRGSTVNSLVPTRYAVLATTGTTASRQCASPGSGSRSSTL